MPNFPENPKEIINRMQTDVKNALPESNPFLKNSSIKATIIGLSGSNFDLYKEEEDSYNQNFIQTATGEALKRHLYKIGITPKAASYSQGFISATGTANTLIPEGTTYQTSNGIQYEVIEHDYEIKDITLQVDSITRSGATATLTTVENHKLANNVIITTNGADQPEYNLITAINVTGEKTLTFGVSGTPATPATGTITLSATYASVEIRATETGLQGNLENAAQVVLSSPISGVDNNASVQFTEVGGGTDEESDDEYRERGLEAYATRTGFYSAYDIIRKARSVAGVTRVEVFPLTPVIGDMTIYFLRDNDTNPIPDGAEVQQVWEALLPVPAWMDEDQVHLNDPPLVGKTFNFTFLTISPDSESMRDAVKQNLRQFFKEYPQVGKNVIADAYRAAIIQTIDPETGNFLESFTLSIPAGDLVVASNEIAVCGDIIF